VIALSAAIVPLLGTPRPLRSIGSAPAKASRYCAAKIVEASAFSRLFQPFSVTAFLPGTRKRQRSPPWRSAIQCV
jgi:hypothetical protein